MSAQTPFLPKEQAEVFKALGHPARLQIVRDLSEGDRCVRELTDSVGTDMSTVSKHLSVLKSTRIVSARKKGNQMWYSLELKSAPLFLSCVSTFLKERTEKKMQALQG